MSDASTVQTVVLQQDFGAKHARWFTRLSPASREILVTILSYVTIKLLHLL
jgi:hypothetical protein